VSAVSTKAGRACLESPSFRVRLSEGLEQQILKPESGRDSINHPLDPLERPRRATNGPQWVQVSAQEQELVVPTIRQERRELR